jgi:glycosyltransferase involved in cell wall biosynthesis
MIRIAFTLIGGKSWTGGYNYLLNLVRVVAEHHAGSVMPVLFFGTDVDPVEAAPFSEIRGVEVVMSGWMNQSRKRASLARSLVLGRDLPVQTLFRQHKIDVVFEAAQFYGRKLGIPAIAWIPDFQHLALPHLFSRAAYWKRELGFRAQIAASRTVMLSSEDARQTCEASYPKTAGKTRVVRFAVPRPSSIPATSQARAVADRYELPERYFFMPNQFWQHKNHKLVVQALELLNRRGQNIVVAASGKQMDPRLPAHFKNIQTSISESGVGENFRLLGLIPYEDLVPLMLASVALLNPSLFEGWSTTVEEARALNVPMLLSDLDVHREQADGIARFFDRHDPASLADALQSAQEAAVGGEAIVPHAPATDHSLTVKRFADEFLALAQHVVQTRSH